MGPAVDPNWPHQRAESVVTAAFAEGFPDLPCNYARAKMRLDANANVFETATQAAGPIAHFVISSTRRRNRLWALYGNAFATFDSSTIALSFRATSNGDLNVVWVGYLATTKQTVCSLANKSKQALA